MNLDHQPSGSPRRVSPPQPGRLLLLPPTRILAEEAEEFLTLSDLRQGATALAEEIHFDPAVAKWEPTSWYWEAVGDPRFSLEQAELLRQMTIESCSQANVLLRYQKSSTFRMQLAERLNGIAFVAVLVALLWLVPVVAQALQVEDGSPTAVSSR